MLYEEQFTDAIRKTYEFARDNRLSYGPTDNFFPVGDNGIIDCTGLVLRALYLLGLVHMPLNCDQLDMILPTFGFRVTEDGNIRRTHATISQWCYPQHKGTVHVNHTCYDLHLHSDGTVDRYDLGNERRWLEDIQPYERYPDMPWTNPDGTPRYVNQHYLWIPKMSESDEVIIEVG